MLCRCTSPAWGHRRETGQNHGDVTPVSQNPGPGQQAGMFADWGGSVGSQGQASSMHPRWWGSALTQQPLRVALVAP